MDVVAELLAPNARIQLVRYRFSEAPDGLVYRNDSIRLDLCLGFRHRSARACFVDDWPAERFEPIGALFAVPPGTTVRARSDERSALSSLVCELKLTPVLELFDSQVRSGQLSEQQRMICLDIRSIKVHALMLRLVEETKHPDFGSRALVESIASQLAVELFHHENTLRGDAGRGGLTPWQLRIVDERLRDWRQLPTLAELAALCRLSVPQLSRGFRLSRGCAIGTYICNSQMQHAVALLLTTDESITSIAFALGFASSSTFCSAFKRKTGMTPQQARQRLPRL
jgi:AraC family transcriptional regulator